MKDQKELKSLEDQDSAEQALIKEYRALRKGYFRSHKRTAQTALDLQMWYIERLMNIRNSVIQDGTLTAWLIIRDLITKDLKDLVRSKTRTNNVPTPPVNAQFLLRFLLSKEEVEAVEGDLIEEYGENAKRLGSHCANWIFYRRVAVSLWPLIKRWLYRMGVIAWITDMVHRLIR